MRAHAAFKYVDETHRYVPLKVAGQRRLFQTLRDYHLFDCAAYRLDRLLGLGRVPPAGPRQVSRMDGTVKLWLEDTMMEKDRRDRGLQPPDLERLKQQREILYVFDNIAGNTDATNIGNALIDHYWNLSFIDCSRCFVTLPAPLSLANVTRCERNLWKRLNELTDDEIFTALEPFLTRLEIDAVIKRKALVVEHIAGEIAKRGEPAVLYDLRPAQAEPAQWYARASFPAGASAVATPGSSGGDHSHPSEERRRPLPG